MDRIIRHLKIWSKSYSLFGITGIWLIVNMLYFNKRKQKTIPFRLKGMKNKVYLRTQTSDFMCFDDVILDQSYSLKISNPEWIIDCGANVGLATVFFKQKYQVAKIVAVEMEDSNFSMLEKNTSGYENVFLEKAAIWSNSSAHLLIEDGEKEWDYHVSTKGNGVESKSIRAITINDIVEKYTIPAIDIIKIDVEGAEKEIFQKGACNWLAITKVLIIELHDRMNPGSSRVFFDAMAEYDFSLEISGENLVFTRNN